MELTELKNLKYKGAAGRLSLLDVIFPSSGIKLPIVFFLHGFKGFKDWGCFPQFAKEIAKQNFTVIKFNFSHNGGTVEDPIDFPDLEAFSQNTYSKEVEDIACVYQWLIDNKDIPSKVMDLDRISLVGHSRGGSMALLAASQYPWVKQVISMAAVADLDARLPVGEELDEWKQKRVRYIQNARTKQEMPIKFSFLEDLKFNHEKLSVQKAVKTITIPQLIIHGRVDETVDAEDAYQLKSWNLKAEIEIIENAGHTFGGKHPWQDNTLPAEMHEALRRMILFLGRR